jgi:predicted Zn-dependent protease
MTGYRAEAAFAAGFAREQAWQATAVAYDAEAKPPRGKPSSSAGSTLGAMGVAQQASGLLGGLVPDVGSLLGTAKKVAPKSEHEQAAEELALGPQIAGRVLGAAPLLDDADAQRRVNVVGRWVASQTSRPDLPWTFGVIDTPEVNAFAAPGGYILVTRGMYQLLDSDTELAAVLGHEISHCVQRDHYNVIRKQQLTTVGKDAVSSRVQTGTSVAEAVARQYVEQHGATILLTALDRDAEFRADKAAEIYLARSGMNPVSLYSVLQKMTALGEQSASLAQLYKTHPPLHERLNRIDERGYRGLEAYTTR